MYKGTHFVYKGHHIVIKDILDLYRKSYNYEGHPTFEKENYIFIRVVLCL